MGKKRRVQDDASSDAEIAKPSKKTKTKTNTAAEADAGKDSEGNSFWALSATRRVVLQEFKGNTFVNIREYYDNNGELRPGKKGIMLSLEQYNALLGAIPDVNAELQSKGFQVSSTPADAPSSSALEPVTESPSKKERKRKKKMNIEATSDEEEDEVVR
ncbi:transcriptional Coactivator p15-domain-containing protein [Nemania sp. FL0916]|nr:transcriptional Coactivator p15-domain-containing protein [Nemania sp. FL0916]